MHYFNKILNNFSLTKNNISLFFTDLFLYLHIKLYLISLIFINALVWSIAFVIYNRLKNELIYLHYNVDFGVNLIGESKNIFIIPILGLLVILSNLFLYGFVNKRKDRKFISHILFSGGLSVNIILLISILLIYLINFR